MYIVCVQVQVKPDRIDDFIRIIKANYEGARSAEPGNVRFDVLQAEDDPAKFLVYEVYRSAADFTAHQQTPHYLTWREAAADMMAAPRVGGRYHNLFPADADWQ
jgi:autoinducer 2-degrading protein